MKRIKEILDWLTAYDYYELPEKERKWLVNRAIEMLFGGGNTANSVRWTTLKSK